MLTQQLTAGLRRASPISPRSKGKVAKRSPAGPKKTSLRFNQKHARDVMVMSKCLIDKRALLLWHYMGTGKTLTALAIAQNFNVPVLVICPAYLKYVWEDQIKIWGATPNKYTIAAYSEYDVILRMRTANRRLMVIVDEVQNCLKQENLRVMGVVKQCDVRLLLSGTPINRMQDLGLLLTALKGPTDTLTQLKFIQMYSRTNYLYLFISKGLKLSQELLNNFFGWTMLVFNTGLVTFFRHSLLFWAGLFWDISNFEQQTVQWNVEKLSEDMKDYVSFVADPGGNSDAEDGFPRKIVQTLRVPLSKPQLNLADRWLLGNLTQDEVVKLGIADSTMGFYFVQPSQVANNSQFEARGRGIGMYHADAVGQSSKGIMLQRLLRKLYSDGDKCMIYSSITSKCGYDGVIEILDEMKIPYCKMDSRDTNEGRRNANKSFNSIGSGRQKKKFNSGGPVVMVNYDVAEGFSLYECMAVVFIEPILNDVAKYQQIIARARRLDSHEHLPKERQQVIVYHLVSTMPKIGKFATGVIDAVEGMLLGASNELVAKYEQEYEMSKFGGKVNKLGDREKLIESNGQYQNSKGKLLKTKDAVKGDFDENLMAAPRDEPENFWDFTLRASEAGKKQVTNVVRMQINGLINSQRPPGYYMRPVSEMKLNQTLQTTYRSGKASFTIGPTSVYSQMIGLVPKHLLDKLASDETGESGKERTVRLFVHSLKPIVMIIKLLLFPKTQMEKLRKWWRGYTNAEETAKLKFALDGEQVREPENYTPDEITMGRLMRQMRALESLIDTIGQKNIQKEEYPRCVKCLTPWPESRIGCQINPI
jgi:hypothetical protein